MKVLPKVYFFLHNLDMGTDINFLFSSNVPFPYKVLMFCFTLAPIVIIAVGVILDEYKEGSKIGWILYFVFGVNILKDDKKGSGLAEVAKPVTILCENVP
jgi:hypothetical protein